MTAESHPLSLPQGASHLPKDALDPPTRERWQPANEPTPIPAKMLKQSEYEAVRGNIDELREFKRQILKTLKLTTDQYS